MPRFFELLCDDSTTKSNQYNLSCILTYALHTPDIGYQSEAPSILNPDHIPSALHPKP